RLVARGDLALVARVPRLGQELLGRLTRLRLHREVESADRADHERALGPLERERALARLARESVERRLEERAVGRGVGRHEPVVRGDEQLGDVALALARLLARDRLVELA